MTAGRPRRPVKGDSLEYVRKTYQVPAYVGVRVTVDGEDGTIVAGDNYIWVRFDGRGWESACHPTWKVTYHVVGCADVVRGG